MVVVRDEHRWSENAVLFDLDTVYSQNGGALSEYAAVTDQNYKFVSGRNERDVQPDIPFEQHRVAYFHVTRHGAPDITRRMGGEVVTD